jgi:long-chain acyl-CoA synthetase
VETVETAEPNPEKPLSIARMAHDERGLRELAEEVERVNARSARIEQVKRFAVAERDLSQDEGELTPTLKGGSVRLALQLTSGEPHGR